MYHLGRNIKQIVENKGVKVSELSEKVGVSQQQIYRIYKQDHLNTELLEKFSEALGEPVLKFFDPDIFISHKSGERLIGEFKESKPKYETALDKCHKELEEWKNKAFETLEKYNHLLEQHIQLQNRQTG